LSLGTPNVVYLVSTRRTMLNWLQSGYRLVW